MTLTDEDGDFTSSTGVQITANVPVAADDEELGRDDRVKISGDPEDALRKMLSTPPASKPEP